MQSYRINCLTFGRVRLTIFFIFLLQLSSIRVFKIITNIIYSQSSGHPFRSSLALLISSRKRPISCNCPLVPVSRRERHFYKSELISVPIAVRDDKFEAASLLYDPIHFNIIHVYIRQKCNVHIVRLLKRLLLLPLILVLVQLLILRLITDFHIPPLVLTRSLSIKV